MIVTRDIFGTTERSIVAYHDDRFERSYRARRYEMYETKTLANEERDFRPRVRTTRGEREATDRFKCLRLLCGFCYSFISTRYVSGEIRVRATVERKRDEQGDEEENVCSGRSSFEETG